MFHLLMTVAFMVGADPKDLSVDQLVEKLKDKNPDQRMAAAQKLAGMGDKAKNALPQICDAAAKDEVEEVRGSAVHALGILRNPDGIPTIIDILQKDKSAIVRALAADAAAEFGDEAKPMVPALIGALKDKEAVVRQHAALTLGKLGTKHSKDAVPALAEGLKDADLRMQAACALAKLEALDEMTKALKDPDEGVRLEIVCAMKMMGKDTIEPLASVLQDKSADVRVNAAAALMARGKSASAALPQLIAALKDNDDAVLDRIIRTVGAFGADAKEALPQLEELAKSKNDNIKKLAENAIKSIKN